MFHVQRARARARARYALLRYEAAATSFFIVGGRSRVVSSRGDEGRLVRAAKGASEGGSLIAIAALDSGGGGSYQ